MSIIDSKIKELRKEFLEPEDKATIKAWEKDFKREILKLELKKNDAIKMLINEMKEKIERVNNLLVSDRNLTEKERDKLFERRDSYEWFLNIFSSAENRIKTIEIEIDNNLS